MILNVSNVRITKMCPCLCWPMWEQCSASDRPSFWPWGTTLSSASHCAAQAFRREVTVLFHQPWHGTLGLCGAPALTSRSTETLKLDLLIFWKPKCFNLTLTKISLTPGWYRGNSTVKLEVEVPLYPHAGLPPGRVPPSPTAGHSTQNLTGQLGTLNQSNCCHHMQLYDSFHKTTPGLTQFARIFFFPWLKFTSKNKLSASQINSGDTL